MNTVSVICRNILSDMMCLPENKRMEKRGREIYEDIIAEKFPSYEENQHTDSRSSVNSNRPNIVKQKQTIQKKKKKKERKDGRKEGGKEGQPRILYPGKISSKSENENKAIFR